MSLNVSGNKRQVHSARNVKTKRTVERRHGLFGYVCGKNQVCPGEFLVLVRDTEPRPQPAGEPVGGIALQDLVDGIGRAQPVRGVGLTGKIGRQLEPGVGVIGQGRVIGQARKILGGNPVIERSLGQRGRDIEIGSQFPVVPQTARINLVSIVLKSRENGDQPVLKIGVKILTDKGNIAKIARLVHQ